MHLDHAPLACAHDNPPIGLGLLQTLEPKGDLAVRIGTGGVARCGVALASVADGHLRACFRHRPCVVLGFRVRGHRQESNRVS